MLLYNCESGSVIVQLTINDVLLNSVVPVIFGAVIGGAAERVQLIVFIFVHMSLDLQKLTKLSQELKLCKLCGCR